MLYNLFEYLNEVYDLPEAGVFQYISFRSAIGTYYIINCISTFWKQNNKSD